MKSFWFALFKEQLANPELANFDFSKDFLLM